MSTNTVIRVLLVDDELALTEPLSRALRHEGYEVDIAHDGQNGKQLATTHSYSLLVLDWMLPKLSGIELCHELRQQENFTPVLLLTAKDTLDDRVTGLDAGADDYLVKPFELRELLARVRALLRRQMPSANPAVESSLITHGIWQLDPENQMVYRLGQAIRLSEKETALLSLFFAAPDQLISHDDIYQALWPNETMPNSNVLAALIRLLRRKLETPGEAKIIQSVYGKGYRFQLSPKS